MKITVDVEFTESEGPIIPQVLQQLQQFSDNVSIRVHTDRATLASVFKESIDAGKSEVVVMEVTRRLSRSELAADCIEVICGLLFDPQRVERCESPMPYLTIVMRLPEGLRARFKDELTQRILRYITEPRPLDAPRSGILSYAEVLAALVKSEAVPARGTLTMITHLIRGEATRVAGITCLGKLVEFCVDVLLDRCDPETMAQLRHALSTAQDENFVYDVEYVMEHMNWSQPQQIKGSPTAIFQRSQKGAHYTPIYAAAYCNPGSGGREIIVTASSDGNVVTWDAAGNPIESFILARHYACSLDVTNRGKLLLLCGVSRARDDVPPAVVLYTCDDNMRWAETGAVEPQGARLISAVRSLSRTSPQFVTAETSNATFAVCLYDTTRVVARHGSTPLREFHEHSDVVTTVATLNDHLIISGSRDCSIFLYDVRSSGSAASHSMCHQGTITSISCAGDYVVSGGLDKRVFVHDIRMLHTPLLSRDLESGVLRVAVANGVGSGNSVCAVSTMTSLHLCNLSSQTLSSNKVEGPAGMFRYYDIEWNHQQNTLFAVGENGALDTYTLAAV